MRLRDRLEPSHLFVVALLVAILGVSLGPLSDGDAYWHVLIGQEIARSGRLSDLGNSWSLITPAHGWQTSQWGFEYFMGWIVHIWNWSALIWMRTLLAIAFLAYLALSLLPRKSARSNTESFTPLAALVALFLVTVPTTHALQERPMLASFIALVWLSSAVYNQLVNGIQPRWYVVAAVVLLWSNLHGMWVLAPAMFGLVSLGLLLDRAENFKTQALTAARLTLIAAVAGCISPLGPRGLLLPFSFHSATAYIEEWQPVRFFSSQAAGLIALVLITIFIWARRKQRLPLSQVLILVLLLIFGMTAYRNILPASILVAPFAVAAMGSTSLLRARPGTVEQRKALAVVSTVFLLASACGVVYVNARVNPLAKTTPLAIAQKLAAIDGPKRVLNNYNASGVLAAFGGSDLKLAIDGRADRDGGDYIKQYLNAESLIGPWKDLVNSVNPNYAVLASDSALAQELLTHQSWTLISRDGEFTLLKAPAVGPKVR
ncbi:unannotated protein [freshwater metagenome]|uniref:Unannotated protein n=1 Tax=freshwater metagenome TaxID=449393 RepID=A0A6J7DR58_9ZZZZ|nr:hypothetical protein [Actinomycetota bacterium]